MGGALALRLAQIYGNEVSGLILINPSIEDKRLIQKFVPVVKYFLPRTRRSARKNGTDVAAPNPPKHSYGVIPLKALASLQKLWKLVGQNLYLINQPLLLGISPQDHVVNPDSAQTLLRHINSVKVTQIEFPNSYHNVALDYDLDVLAEESLGFIRDVLSGAVNRDEHELINAEFDAIVSGLSLDESSDRTFLDDLEASEDVESYQGDNAPLPKLTQIQRAALVGVIGGPLYMVLVQFFGVDVLGIGAWPGAIALAAGIVTFFWQMRPEREDDDDGVAL